MPITNGQDQSAAFRRERERLSLEQGWGESPLLDHKPQERGSVRSQAASSELARALAERAFARHEGMVFKPQRAWNVVYDPAGISVRSRQKLTGLAEGYKNVCVRWSLDVLGMARILHLEEESGLCDLILSGQVPPMTGDLKDRMAFVIGISIGLGDLFDDDKDGELEWLNSTRPELGGVSSLEHMLKGDLLNIRDVVDLVDNARGLK